jgi:hypothetical protein
MGIVPGLLLLVVGAIVGLIDRYAAQRNYASLYAERHGTIPPLTDWFFVKDNDAEVDGLRRQHRNLTILTFVLSIAAVFSLVALR